MNITIDTNLDEQLDKVKELIHYLREIENTTELLRFITIKEFSEITGWRVPTVQNLYNRSDFPLFEKLKVRVIVRVMQADFSLF